MDGTAIASVVLRAAHLAALMSLFGVLVFSAVVVRTLPGTPWARSMQSRMALLGWWSVSLALILGVAWLAVRTAVIAGAATMEELLSALPVVALETQFGRLVLARFAMVLALLPLCPGQWCRSAPLQRAPMLRRLGLPIAILLAGGALGLQAATSHAGAGRDAADQSLLAAEALHILAAGAWLGGLAPLLIGLATMPPEAAAVALRRFLPLGLASVTIIAATSVMQAVSLVGGIPAMVGTAYGRMALLKLLLFTVMLACAALNRFVLGARPGAGLRRSVMSEAAMAMLVMLAAGSLAHLTPGVHEQATWPFPWRLSPDANGPLFTAAYPTSFFVSPTGFAASAIVRGEGEYRARCIACHGTSGQGDGPGARSLPVAPADLTRRQIADYRDGDLFWLVGHGVDLPNPDLQESVRWDLVDYLRARARGELARNAGKALRPLRMPRFDVVCGKNRSIDVGELRGQVLRITAFASSPAAQHVTDLDRHAVTVSLADGTGPRPGTEACLAQPEARDAFAILLGTTADALAGSEWLVDPNGWLRAQWRRGDPGGWATADILVARVQVLAARPLPISALEGQPHRH